MQNSYYYSWIWLKPQVRYLHDLTVRLSVAALLLFMKTLNLDSADTVTVRRDTENACSCRDYYSKFIVHLHPFEWVCLLRKLFFWDTPLRTDMPFQRALLLGALSEQTPTTVPPA